MKNLTFLLPLLLFGCTYDSIFDEYGYSGEGSATINGDAWAGKVRIAPKKQNLCEPDTCFGILLTRYFKNGLTNDYLVMDFLPLKLGKQHFRYVWPTYINHTNSVTYGKFTTEGDVVDGGYSLFKESPDNYFEITELDMNTGYVKGNFQVEVVRDSFWTPVGSIPDTVRFTNGSFSGRVYWE